METIDDIFTSINRGIQQLEIRGGSLHMQGNGTRPRFLVHSLYPLAYEVYGRRRNKGPQLYGEFALRGFMTTESPMNPDVVQAYGVLDGGRMMYGCHTDADEVNHILGLLEIPSTVLPS